MSAQHCCYAFVCVSMCSMCMSVVTKYVCVCMCDWGE